jgi:hypothetical protein
MAKISNIRKERFDFDVSSGTSTPMDHRPADDSAAPDASETSAGLRYSAETILGLRALSKDISDIYARCQLDNWDGDGATAISIAAYMHAVQLLRHLPSDLPLPSAHPDSDGYIELEWYQAGKTFSILIGARLTLFWAGYYSHDKRRSGREPFDGTFPTDLTVEIKKVYA